MAQEKKTILPDPDPDTSHYEAEAGLPLSLRTAIDGYKRGREKLNAGERYLGFDMDFCELASAINVAEVEQIITPEYAWYLREKYLGMLKEDNT